MPPHRQAQPVGCYSKWHHFSKLTFHKLIRQILKYHAYRLLTLALFTFVFCYSCKQKKENLQTNSDTLTETVNSIYEYDTTLFELHSSGFYISKNGNVFQKNSITIDDSTGIWTTHYWLDSLMFFGDYPNKKSLRQIIDLNTFVSDTLTNFEKDKNHVYFRRGTSDGVYRYIVANADAKTFTGITQRWGKDINHIFYGTEVVKQADLKSFEVCKNQDSAKDKNHIYHLGEVIK